MHLIQKLSLPISTLALALACSGAADAQQAAPAAPTTPEVQQFRDAHFNGNVSVRGEISAHSLRLTPKTADFVFRDDYRLRPLEEVERFIRENGHLPEIPSEKEMLTHGVAVETLNGLYLQKIEELTLYLIAQQREIAELRDQMRQGTVAPPLGTAAVANGLR